MSRIRMDTPRAVEVFRDLVRMVVYYAPASAVTKHRRAVFRKAIEHLAERRPALDQFRPAPAATAPCCGGRRKRHFFGRITGNGTGPTQRCVWCGYERGPARKKR
jgi:hypothetical protein